ncbi:MAG: hypothetical protein ACJ72W_26500 [Actinoallomurus sp.]
MAALDQQEGEVAPAGLLRQADGQYLDEEHRQVGGDDRHRGRTGGRHAPVGERRERLSGAEGIGDQAMSPTTPVVDERSVLHAAALALTCVPRWAASNTAGRGGGAKTRLSLDSVVARP